MLETKYYKDYRHNYLILKDNGCLSENVYQRKMMTENSISGLLESSEKHINGELLIYYEISSKQSLQSYFAGRTIGIDFLKKFFIQLKMVNDVLQKYLLDGNCMVLLPEYIFLDVGTEEISFLYYPNPEEGSLSDLMNFFLSGVDNEDMKAVEMVYKITDLIQRDQFALDEVLEWFQDDCYSHKEKTVFQSGRMEEKKNNLQEEVINEDNGCIDTLVIEKEKKENEKIKKVLLPVILAATGMGALVYIMNFYHLSYMGKLYLAVGWGMVILILGGTAVWYFAPEALKQKKQKEGKETEQSSPLIPTNERSIQHQTEPGNTVFIPWAESCENKLYGVDRKNKYHIDLEMLPLTVGKLAGMVDMIIDEQSISRMHARFSRSGSRIYITDLNSTNGTFRNGMRLEPNTSELIEPGDEIRLGKLKFIYR